MSPYLRLLRPTLVLTLLGALAAPAEAGTCGGGVACECGDIVVRSTSLDRNVEGCSRTGLEVAAGVTLDCNGHSVIGRSSKDGIKVDEAPGARVRNCRVEGFRTGIRVAGGSGQLVSSNHLVGNRRGITISDEANDVRVESNTVEASREIGILVQAGTWDVEVVRNTVNGSRKENIRVTSSPRIMVEVNTLGGRPKVGLQVTHTEDGVFRGNEIQGSDVEVRGKSLRNLFLDNDLLDGGFDVKTHESGESAFAPMYNTFRGGSIPNARRCFTLRGASFNVIENVRVGECAGRAVELKKSDGFTPEGNEIDLATTGAGTGNGGGDDRTCGADDEPCKCRDRVVESTRLEADITDCGKTGLVVAEGVTLDCAGFGVFGKSSSDGILVEGNDTRVRNCRVQGFNSGLRIKEGTSHLVADNVFTGNRRGIIVDGGVSDSTLDNNAIDGSRDIGIELRDGPTDIQIKRNTVMSSNKQNIDIKLATNPVVEQNILGGKTKDGIRLTDTTGARIRGNTIETEGISLRGGSTMNEFLDNDLEDQGFEFEGIEERSGPWRFPEYNLIKGGEVLNARRCFTFKGASFNTVDGVAVDECAGREVETKKVDGHVPTGNVIDVVVR